MLLLNRSDPFWLQYTFPYRYPANVVVVAVVVPLPRGVRWLLGCLLAPILLPPPCLSVVGRSIGHVVS